MPRASAGTTPSHHWLFRPVRRVCMTNHRTTYCPGCRSDRAPCRGVAGDLPALTLAGHRASILGHLTALADIPSAIYSPISRKWVSG